MITIEQAQAQVDQWIKTVGVRYFSELTNMAILTEEVGELARLMARTYGDQSFKGKEADASLADELADVLWVLICIANQTGVNLTEAFARNMEKKSIRDASRHQDNSPGWRAHCWQAAPPAGLGVIPGLRGWAWRHRQRSTRCTTSINSSGLKGLVR